MSTNLGEQFACQDVPKRRPAMEPSAIEQKKTAGLGEAGGLTVRCNGCPAVDPSWQLFPGHQRSRRWP